MQRKTGQEVRKAPRSDEDGRTSKPETILAHQLIKEGVNECSSKGPQFVIAPKINAVDIAAPIEAALQFSTAPLQAVETARMKVCDAIARAK